MNIVVLAGGLSTERFVSFKSGAKIAKTLTQNGHNALLLDVFMGLPLSGTDPAEVFADTKKYSLSTEDIPSGVPDIKAIRASRPGEDTSFFGPNVIRLCRYADVTFVALHGADGENGKVQAAFDLMDICYTGNGYLGSAIAMNKVITKKYLVGSGVPFPNGISLFVNEPDREEKLEKLTFPCVVKPASGGSSIGVSIVNEKEQLAAALDDAFFWDKEVLIEEYIKGREFAVGVLENKVLPVIEIAPVTGFYDYKNKYAAGAAVETCPAALSEEKTKEMQTYAGIVAERLGLDTYCRMDFLLDDDENIYCLEANTLPGMTPTSLLPQEAEVEGISYSELCEKLIAMALNQRKEQ